MDQHYPIRRKCIGTSRRIHPESTIILESSSCVAGFLWRWSDASRVVVPFPSSCELFRWGKGGGEGGARGRSSTEDQHLLATPCRSPVPRRPSTKHLVSPQEGWGRGGIGLHALPSGCVRSPPGYVWSSPGSNRVTSDRTAFSQPCIMGI